MDNSVAIFKALGDKTRLTIVRSLLETPMYVELLSLRLNLTAATISFHLKKLEEVGIVSAKKEQYYVLYSLNREILNNPLISLIDRDIEEIDDQNSRHVQYIRDVIDTYIVNGKLSSIPVQYMKRRIVLEEISKALDPCIKYTEREINIILADYFDDFVSLRKALVSEGFINYQSYLYSKIRNNKILIEDGEISIMTKSIAAVPQALTDSLTTGEKIIYEVEQDNLNVSVLGFSNNNLKLDRILFSNKGRAFIIKNTCKDISQSPAGKNYVFIYSFTHDRKGIKFDIRNNTIFLSAKKLACTTPSSLAGCSYVSVEFTLNENDFKCLVNSFEHKLFIE